jgi:hypothetical protein
MSPEREGFRKGRTPVSSPDNGTSWYITGSADCRWNDDDLDQLKSVPGSAFEAVEIGEPIRR